MVSLLVKRISRFFPFSHHKQPAALVTPLLRLSLSTQPQQPEDMPFIAQYLVSSFGFSPDRALKVSISRKLTMIKSPDRPVALVSFLKEIGLSDLQIRSLVSFHPNLLLCSVDNLIKPRVLELIDAGFTGELLIHLVRLNPQCLYLKNTLMNLRFWRNFVGNSDETLLKLIKTNHLLITYDIDKHVIPKINLLREYGLSDQQIVRLISCRGNLLLRGIDYLRWVLEKTEELGILQGSNMYYCGVKTLGSLTKEAVANRLSLFKKMYGWSEKEICSAFRKSPGFLGFSEENISSKMDFLINRAGVEPRTIASQPRLLSCSIERTLIPRHNVLCALQAKGLIRKGNLLSVCVLSEKRFLGRYVVPYEEDLPELAKTYSVACAGNLPN